MLYPDFNDLISLKERKSGSLHPSSRLVKSSISGNHASPFRGQGLEFDSVREYVPGDDIRNIDWRVTARTGSPHLKIFKEERERHIILCIDMNAAMQFGTKNTFKTVQAARTAAFLGWNGIAHQDRIGACLFGDVPNAFQFFPPKRTSKSFCTILKTLATPHSERHQFSLTEALQQIDRNTSTGSLIYLISDFMDLNKNLHESCIKRLNKKCEVVFIAINDQADQSIFPVGSIGFSANETEKIKINTHILSGRKAYAAQWKKNRDQLYEMTSRFKIPLLELTTESDVRRDLSLGLKSISKRKKR